MHKKLSQLHSLKKSGNGSTSPGSLTTRILSAFFFIAFSSAFVYLSYTQITALQTAYDAKGWIPVEGTLQSWELKSTKNNKSVSTQYKVQYSYTYKDASYESKAIAPLHNSSNFDTTYKNRLHALFTAADASQSRITVWIDPNHPERSVLVRDISLALSAFVCFFLIFPCALGSVFFVAIITSAGEWLGSTSIRHRIWYLWCLYHGGIAWISLGAGNYYMQSPGALSLLILIGCIWPYGWWKLYTKSRKQLSKSS